MPSIPLHLSPTSRSNTTNPLPTLLQTPSGLAILEIQGTIHTPSFPSEPITPSTITSLPINSTATPIGRLVFPHYSKSNPSTSWMKTVLLYVGRHQRLTGEVKKLPKPVAVIRRREAAGASTGAEAGDELEIVDVVYYKILFSSRPEPVGDSALAT